MSKAKVGEKPLVVITHSLGTLIFKRILEYANEGDPRLKPLKDHLKGVLFIAGPNRGVSFMGALREELNSASYLLRFDSLGSLAVNHEEAMDNLVATLNFSKTSYYIARKIKSRLDKLQKNFDSMNIKAMTISEGKHSRMGLFGSQIMVIDKEDAVMKGYPNVHIEDKNHSQVNKVRDEKDPTLITVTGFIDECFGKNKTPKN